MAAALGISPSYLNLIERNHARCRPACWCRSSSASTSDPRSLREDEAIGGLDGLVRRMADERFADLGIGPRGSARKFLAAAPQIAAAFARLYDQAAAGLPGAKDAAAAARRRDRTLAEPFCRSRSSGGGSGRRNCACRAGKSAPRWASGLARKAPHDRAHPAGGGDAGAGPTGSIFMPVNCSFPKCCPVRRGGSRSPGRSARWKCARRSKPWWPAPICPRAKRGIFSASILPITSPVRCCCPICRFLRACEQTGYDLGVFAAPLCRQLRSGGAAAHEHWAGWASAVCRFFMASIDRAGRLAGFTAGGAGVLYPLEGARLAPRGYPMPPSSGPARC